jgi:N6-adenosine-specific RNA methylase IME4
VNPLPGGPFGVMVADPPWMYQKRPGIHGAGRSARGTADLHYATLTNEEIRDLPVRESAAADAHLFLWVTNPGVYGGRFSELTPGHIAAAWGFEYRTLLTWVKTSATGEPIRSGLGWYFRGCTEHVLYATRGAATVPAALREPNVILAPRGRHSAKPPEFMQLVERVTTGDRLELFGRGPRPGWTVWGDEADRPAPRPVVATANELALFEEVI